MKLLSDIIKQAAAKMGGVQALEDYLGLPRKTLSMVGKTRGLPDFAQAKLEELMELTPGSLRAPSAIITEKKPERRAYWEKKLETLALCALLAVVTNFVTPSPAEASTGAISHCLDCILC